MDIDGEGAPAAVDRAADEATAAVAAVKMDEDSDDELPKMDFSGVAGPPISIERPKRVESAVVLRNNAALIEKLRGVEARVTPEMVAMAEQAVKAQVPMVRDAVRGVERPLNLQDRDEVMRFAAAPDATHRVYVEAAGGPAGALVALSGAQRDEPRNDPRGAMLGVRHDLLPFPTSMLFPLTSDPRFNDYMRNSTRYVAEALAVGALMPCAVRTPRLLMLLSGQRLPYVVDSFATVLAFYMPALQHALRTRDMCRPSRDVERRIAGLAIDDDDGGRDTLAGGAAASAAEAAPAWRVRISGAPPQTTRTAFNNAAQRAPAVRDALVARGVLPPERAKLGCLFGVADMLAFADSAAPPASAGDAGTVFEFVVENRDVFLALHTALHGSTLRGLSGGAACTLHVEELGKHTPRRTTPATYFEHFLGAESGGEALRREGAAMLAAYYPTGAGRLWRLFVPELRAADGLPDDVLSGAPSGATPLELYEALHAAFEHCRERVRYDYEADRREWDTAHAQVVAATMRSFDTAEGGASMLIEGGGGDGDDDGGVLPVALEAALAEQNHHATVELLRRIEVALLRCYASVVSEPSWRTDFVSVPGPPPDARVTAAVTERSVAASCVAVAAYRHAVDTLVAAPGAEAEALAALPLELGCDPRAPPADPIAVRRAWHQFRSWVYSNAEGAQGAPPKGASPP